MVWYLPIRRWELQSDGLPVARIVGNVPVSADSSRVRRNDEAVFTTLYHCRLFRSGKRDVSQAGGEGNVPGREKGKVDGIEHM